MEIISKIMPPDYEIVDTGDWHIGPDTCNIDGIKEMIDYVASNKNVYLVLKGDLIDAIAPNDRRYAHCTMINPELLTAQNQANYALNIIRPVKDRVLLVQLGNHEWGNINTIDFAKYWSQELDVKYGGYVAKFIHKDKKGKVRFKHFYTHGTGSSNSTAESDIARCAAEEKALIRKLVNTGHADCVYMSMGHWHKLLAIDPTIQDNLHFIDDGKEVKARYQHFKDQNAEYIPPNARYYGCSGSFLKTNSRSGIYSVTYSEKAMYGPLEHGYLKVTIRDHEMVKLEKVVV